MADGYEPYHVPQQSRRDKLRVVAQNNQHHHHHPGCVDTLQGCAGLLPLYDPSLLPPDLLTCANIHHQTVKEEGVNLMGYVGGGIMNNNASSSSSTSHHLYMDPQSSIHINPSSIQEINTNPFLYTTQNLRVFDQSFNGCDQVVAHQEGLSLSLSSHHTHRSNLPLELNLQRYDPSIFNNKVSGGGGYVIPAIVGGGGGGGSTSKEVSRSSVPLGPFTGYTSILKGSKFLRPAQQLLEELCSRGIYGQKITQDSNLIDSPMESLSETGNFDDSLSSGDGRKKSRLISMLDEVYRRYKHYYQQMQAVIESFESVAGLSNAAPYANLALKAMSKHFKCLKNAIAEQLQFLSKTPSQINYRKDESPRFENSDRCLYSQRAVNSSGFLENQPVWRPQRGLPERAVSVLRAWLFEHFLHPYPTDTDKLMLAKQTGLSRSQVSNWFINARVRLWKPMVEEIHMLETRQTSKASTDREEQNADRARDHLPTAPSTSSQMTQDLRPKRTRNEISDISMTSEEAMNLSYDNLSRLSHAGIGGSGGVSLTLGLHQNNGLVNLSEPFQVHAGQRFGLDANGDGYVIGSFEAPNRQFGRDIMGGQLLHDFVG